MGCIGLIGRWIISSIIIALIVWILPGIKADGFWTIMWFSAVWGLVSVSVKPILQFISLPITFITFGIFYFVVSTLMVMLAGSMVDGFRVDGFGWALLFSAIYAIIASIIGIKGYGGDE